MSGNVQNVSLLTGIKKGDIKMKESEFKQISPDKNLIRITEKIIAQNDLILKMNSDLLKTITMPIYICNNEGHTEIKE